MGIPPPNPTEARSHLRAGAQPGAGSWSTVAFLPSSSPSSLSLPPQSHKAHQAATPCCANYLWSKGGYLRFSHSTTQRLHKKECRAWNLLAKEPLEWSSLGNGRLGWSSWVKDQVILSRCTGTIFLCQRSLGWKCNREEEENEVVG